MYGRKIVGARIEYQKQLDILLKTSHTEPLEGVYYWEMMKQFF